MSWLLVFQKHGQGLGGKIFSDFRADIFRLQRGHPENGLAGCRQLLAYRPERTDVAAVLRAVAVVAAP